MVLGVRPALASVFAVVAAIVATVAPFYEQPYCYIVPGMLAASPLLAHRRAFALQLLTRGIWASTFIYAAIVLINWVFFLGHWRFNNHFILVQRMLALASGGSLFVMGGAGLEPEEACPFRPIAFRRTLLALMVIATASALECVLKSVFWLVQGFADTGDFALGALYALTPFGIYRLRVWGLVLNLLAAVFLLRMAPSGPSAGLAFGRSLVPLSQIGLMVPIAVAIVRAQRSRARSR
jgi:hypothetical protein